AEHEKMLVQYLSQNLREIPGLTLYEPRSDDKKLPVVSFTLANSNCSEIGFRLDREFSIMTRVGLHCAPRAHQSIGTFPQGTVRLAPGYFNKREEMAEVIMAVSKIAAGYDD
ncbi:MAG: aminotransferase class V-fold PLP-dependent enzyme, partial [Deltaproteobacteria bacterium]|nr:aminotransferase class V-fold PLP-dependent enzyme [Candidatus Tharpella sp.]